MEEFKNKPEPKKIKMPSIVDRTQMYDMMSWSDDIGTKENEDHTKNNTQSLSELESDKIN